MNLALSGNTIGPFPIGRRVGDFVFLSGAGGVDMETGVPVPGGVPAETHQIMKNMSEVLAQVSLSLRDVVSVTCYLTDIADWPLMNEIYATYFEPGLLPSRTAVEVSDLPNNLSVEMTMTAYSPARGSDA
jgi:2-iminobutanoate/2-iminopropanoate deaminase